MAFKRIVAKSESDLENILDDIKEWFKSSKDYTIKFSKETRKFMEPETKKIVEKSIEVIELKDNTNNKQTTIKFIPMKEKNEMKIELGGEGESVIAGKISNQMKSRGTLKSYSKDKKLPLKENIMKKSKLKQIIQEEISKIIKEGFQGDEPTGDGLSGFRGYSSEPTGDGLSGFRGYSSEPTGHGISLKNLPNKVVNAMSYEYNLKDPKYKTAIYNVFKWVKNNLSQLEDGKSISFISNKGEDFKEIAIDLETSPEDIIEYIDIQIDQILGY